MEADTAVEGSLSLWNHKPASQWVEALPIGNGSLGAMIYAGVQTEHLQINEDTVWTGKPHDYTHTGAVKTFPVLRDLMLEMLRLERNAQWDAALEVQKQAESLAMETFMSQPLGQKSYQPAGDLWLEFSGHLRTESYRRDLNLVTATAAVKYACEGVTYQREAFASYPRHAIAVKVTADKSGALDFKAYLSSPHPFWG